MRQRTVDGEYQRAGALQSKLENAIDRLQISYTVAQWVRREISKENAALSHVEEQRDFRRSLALSEHIAKVVRWSEEGFGDLGRFSNYGFRQKMRESTQAITRTVIQERTAETFVIPLAQVVSITISATTKDVLQREKIERSTLEVDKKLEVHAGEPDPPIEIEEEVEEGEKYTPVSELSELQGVSGTAYTYVYVCICMSSAPEPCSPTAHPAARSRLAWS